MKHCGINLLLSAALLPLAAHAAGTPRPNIIFILADDIGSGDLSCYGSVRTQTPSLDRLAVEGMRCTDVHASASMCTASRYSLLTGRYSWRDGITPVARPLNPALIPVNRPNLASLLKSAGYATAVVGKWHLGFGETGPDFNGELKPGPLELGFDYYYGFPTTNDRVPPVYVENHRVVNLDPADPIIVDERKPVGDDPTADTPGITLKLQPSEKKGTQGGHRGTVINGISRMGYMAGGKAARWVDEEMADVLTGKAIEFIERSKDRPFFLYFATHNVHAPLAPNARFRGTSQAGMWGDSVHEFDWSVGEVLKTLDRLGLRENTLVIFSSDNGGKIADGYLDPEAVASGHVPNAPWRGTKYTLYEGGHRVPFIARWPGHIPAGAVSGELFGLVDMVATFSAILGRPMPPEAVDSVNALPALLEARPAKPVREWHISANRPQPLSLRKGSWKFIEKGRGGELFNLADDPAETMDLFAQRPEVVKEMLDILSQVRATVQPAPASQK